MTLYAGTASTEYVRVPVTVSPDLDPTANEVEFSLPASGGIPETWILGEWEAGGPPYIARALVGSYGGDIELDQGTYDIWLRITDPPEVPAFVADRLVVFGISTLLASVSQLADVLGADIDPENAKARQVLADASALFRSKTGQLISFVEEDLQELRGNWSPRLWLPQKPVVDVCSLSLRRCGDTVYQALDVGSLQWSRRGLLQSSWYDWGGPDATVKVSYDHGYAVVPEDVQAVVLGWAARAYESATGQGVASKQIGSAQIAYFEGGASTEAVGRSALEEAVVAKYSYQEGS